MVLLTKNPRKLTLTVSAPWVNHSFSREPALYPKRRALACLSIILDNIGAVRCWKRKIMEVMNSMNWKSNWKLNGKYS